MTRVRRVMPARASSLAWLLVVAALPGPALAHRLDELLQAVRFGVEPDRIEVELDLTPGVQMAPGVWRQLDANADGQVSPDEARAYGGQVLGSVHLSVDGREVRPSLSGVTAPGREEIGEGVGIIRLSATASVASLPGRHELAWDNGHEPAASVYLANALMPTNPAVRVVAQRRDEVQRRYWMEYEVSDGASKSGRSARRRWFDILFTAGVLILGFRLWRHSRATGNAR